MKKFLLILVIFLFTTTSANAGTTTVRFNSVGVPVSAARGTSRPVSVPHTVQHNYYTGKIRPTLPGSVRAYGYARRIYYAPPIVTNYYIPAQTQTAATTAAPSRLDKNTRAIIPTKSYTMNGVTYYN